MKDIFKILEQDYIRKLFENKKLIYFPELEDKKLTAVEIKKISPDWAGETCVARYKAVFDGGAVKIVRGKASFDETNTRTWQIMNYLYGADFASGQSQVARPLDFIEENNFLLYEEVFGAPLSLVVQGGDFIQISSCFKQAAVWLAKLHKIKADEKKLPAAVFFNADDFVKIFEQLANLFPDSKDKVILKPALKFIDDIRAEEKYVIHNDFYPGNIIVGQKIIFGIDFEKSGLGSRWLDLATFLGWLNFPAEIQRFNFNLKEIKKLKSFFLETYCSACQMDNLSVQQFLDKYLAKIYLDQIYYYTVLCAKGWDFFSAKDKLGYEIKIKALLEEVKKRIL